MLLAAGFEVVLCEYVYADVVAFRRVGNHIHVLSLELERTTRNAVRNARRDIGTGSDIVLEIGMTSAATAAIARAIKDQFTPTEQSKVRIVAMPELTIDLLQGLNGDTGADPVVKGHSGAKRLEVIRKEVPRQ